MKVSKNLQVKNQANGIRYGFVRSAHNFVYFGHYVLIDCFGLHRLHQPKGIGRSEECETKSAEGPDYFIGHPVGLGRRRHYCGRRSVFKRP